MHRRALDAFCMLKSPSGLFCLITLFIGLDCHLHAQDTLSNTSYGKEFYVCLPLNDEILNKKDTLVSFSLFVTPYKKVAANVTVSYLINGTQEQFHLYVKPDSVGWLRIPFELEVASRIANENKAIHIESDEDIGVYVLSHKRYSSDAYLAFPVTSLDSTYIVSSWKNIIKGGVIGAKGNKYGGFVLIATENNTMCKIVPSCPLDSPLAAPGDTVSVLMNRGQVRYVTASAADVYDITGTIVFSAKPFVMLSVHERASIPNVHDTYNFLVEQNPPVSLLGTDYIINPFNAANDNVRSIARVNACYDATRIKGAGVDTVLYSREFIEFDCKQANYIRADKPILVAQYEMSSSVDSSSTETEGDPFMVFVPSIEQYCRSYTIISPPDSVFTVHWLSMTVSKKGVGSLKVDGTILPDSVFFQVESSNYYCVRLRVLPGVHRLSCDSEIGAVAYGFGVWDGYGYCAGMKTERILEKIMDKQPPLTLKDISCGKGQVIMTDTGAFVSGIDTVFVRSQSNVTIAVSKNLRDFTKIVLTVILVDSSRDGFIEYFALDKAGNMTHDTLYLNGFTISSQARLYQALSLVTTVDSLCFINTGQSTQFYTLKLQQNYLFAIPPHISLSTLVVPAHSSICIPLYILVSNPSDVVDTLTISDPCGRQKSFVLHAKVEEGVYVSVSSCDIPVIARSTSGNGVYLVSSRINSSKYQSTLTIYSVLGALVKIVVIEAGGSFEMASLNSGVYLYHVETGLDHLSGTLLVP